MKILWKRGKIAPEEQFLPLSTIFYYLMLDFSVKTGIRFSVRDKRLFEITEVEITRVDCTCKLNTLIFFRDFNNVTNVLFREIGKLNSQILKIYKANFGYFRFDGMSIK